jgi:hypothetical protein
MVTTVVFGLALWFSILFLISIWELITEHKLSKNLGFTLFFMTLVVVLWCWFFYLTNF